MDKKKLIKQLDIELKSRFKELGFKYSSPKFIKEDGDYILSVSIVKISKDSSSITLSPIVGVLNKRVEDILHNSFEILDHNYKYKTAHIAKSLGYLMPENSFTEWVVDINSNYSIILDDIFNKLNAYGFPAIQTWKNLNIAIDELLSGKGTARPGHDLIPIYYYLNGNKQEAINYLKDKMVDLNRVQVGYKEFAEKLIDYINKN